MFVEKYEKSISQIINLFKEEKFKNARMNVYNSKPSMLSPLEMYVIEEIYRLGNNNYFNTLNNLNIETNDIIEEYNIFMKKCRSDFDFELFKVKEFYQNENNLNNLEKFCISLILKDKEAKEIIDKRIKYKYDDLYELEYETDEEIKETLANIALSIEIKLFLSNDNLYTREIKERQLSNGVFSDIDKQYLIDYISNSPVYTNRMEKVVQILYPLAKKFIDDNNGEEILNNLFGMDVNEIRTNIRAKEVYDKIKGKTK